MKKIKNVIEVVNSIISEIHLVFKTNLENDDELVVSFYKLKNKDTKAESFEYLHSFIVEHENNKKEK